MKSIGTAVQEGVVPVSRKPQGRLDYGRTVHSPHQQMSLSYDESMPVCLTRHRPTADWQGLRETLRLVRRLQGTPILGYGASNPISPPPGDICVIDMQCLQMQSLPWRYPLLISKCLGHQIWPDWLFASSPIYTHHLP